MNYDLGLVLDGVILVFLGVTIFYAARLSLFLKVFREGRNGMQMLIRDLSVTIDKAETSIQNMKDHAKKTEAELLGVVRDAKALSDELGFMNETGDSLASRLEKLADRNRELVDLMENAGGIGSQTIRPFDPAEKAYAQAKSKAAAPSRPMKPKAKPRVEDNFEISDFEVDEDDEHDFLALSDGAYREDDVQKQMASHQSRVNTEAKSKVRSFAIFDREHIDDIEDDFQEEDDNNDDGFHSRAEKDLYDALQRRKRVSESS